MAGIVSKDIYRLVKTTTTEIDIMDRMYHGDVDAYNIDIEFYGVTSITGTCNLHFVLPDGTALDKDASDGVVIDGNNVKYTLPTYLYQQSGNLTMYVQFMNSNIYTPLKVNFKNIVAIPDGGEEVVATTTYPVWYDEVVTNEDERVAAELIRVSNEVSRVTAETARSTWEEFSAAKVYAVGEKVYYPTTGSSYILHTASGVANTLPTDTDYWQIIVEKGASGIIDEFSLTDITGVIAGDGTSITTASANDLPYVNTTSGLAATDAQAAIDELASEKEDSVNIGNRTYTEQNYVTNGESVTASIDALDVSLIPSLLTEVIVEADTTEVEITGLDINVHKSYRIEIETKHNVSGYSSSIGMFINNDTTPTNYYSQSLTSIGSTTTSNRMNNAYVIGTSREDVLTNFPAIAIVNLRLVNGKAVALSLSTQNTDQFIMFRNFSWIYKNTVSNITSIKFIIDPAMGIPAGAKFRVYRGDK